MTNKKSAYCEASERFQDPEHLYTYLQEHLHDDTTLWLGYYLMRARRLEGRDLAQVAHDAGMSPLSISMLLSGKSEASPAIYDRLAHALDANPVELFLASGWLTPTEVAEYTEPDNQDGLAAEYNWLAAQYDWMD